LCEQSTEEVHQAFKDDVNMDVQQAMAFGLIDSVLEPGQIVGHAIQTHPAASKTPVASTTKATSAAPKPR
jgi:hypothetical protein